MASTQQLLDKARSQLGVVEQPFGSNQVLYATWAGIPGQAWCGAFVSWCFAEVGMAAQVPKFVWTPSGAEYFQRKNQWGRTPQIGAVAFFQWPGAVRIVHTALVEAIRTDGVVTIEGNTDEAGGGTGGKVMRHVRRAYIVGYGYPAYDALVAATPTSPAIPILSVARPMIKQGNRGPNVVYLQQKLGIAVDGIFGPQTRARVMQFQKNHGLVADGVVGPRTWAAVG